MIAFEDIWREHKRFIIAIGAGAIAFFGGLSTVWSIDDAVRRVTKQNLTTEADIRDLIANISGREGSEAGIAIALDKDVTPATRDAVQFRPRDAFALKEGDSPFIVYRSAIEEVERARAEALRRNISCPEDLGFLKDPPEERVRVHIVGADLAEKALSALVGVGVKGIEGFRPGDPEYVKLVEEPEQKDPLTGQPVPPPADAGPEPLWLRRIPLRITATGSLDALERFLSGFQTHGTALEVGALKVARAAEGAVKFDVEVAALTLVAAAEAKAAAKPGSGSQQRPGQRPTIQRPGSRLR